ncbi:transcription activator for actt3 protein [Colletotrichum chrysophilum]|uniref:Transcription activator for actt3 protein n=1 Tax=Colletotrichum chrysophilum TaxID=1836956 RepID=A0AAD9EEZ5_9PEZI|nr:transcription activator for actt3 protein [Colletotrichum chrysophilum]
MEQQPETTLSSCKGNNRDADNSTCSERLPRFRASCDSCTRSKLRCDGGKPSCGRCSDRDESCVYSRIGRVGRPPRLPASQPGQAQSHCTARNKASRSHRRATINEFPTTKDLTNTTQGPSGHSKGRPKDNLKTACSDDIRSQESTHESNENDCISVQTTIFLDPWLSSHGDEDSPSGIQHLLTPISDDSMAAMTSVSGKFQNTKPTGIHGDYIQEEGLDFDAFDLRVITPSSAPAGTTRFQDEDLKMMDLGFDDIMDPDFDIDIDFISSNECLAPQSQSPSTQQGIWKDDAMSETPVIGDLENIWNQIMSGTSKLQRVVGSIAPALSRPFGPDKKCSCPTLIGRLQLLAIHPRLSPQRQAGHRRYGHNRLRQLPLDLLVFLDDAVYQTVVTVRSCGVCGNAPRALLTLCLHVDWLVDVLKETLETGLPGLSTPASVSSTQSLVLPGKQGTASGIEELRADGVSGRSNGKGTLGGYGDLNDTLPLSLGSFQLEGELWKICIRELLKARLNRLSLLLEEVFHHEGIRDRVRNTLKDTDYDARSPLDKAVRSLAGDIYSKIEFLFGMLELWQTC